jgi:beta-glucosidase
MRGYAGELDFLGVNYYAPRRVRAGPGKLLASEDVRVHGATYTEMGWEVYPGGLSEILARVWRDYAPPAIYVTENGAAFDDHREGDRVADPARVDYLERHLTECARAIELGVPLRGYFVWSLLDNFEWQHGYTKRFGIVYTDYATQRRIEKSSARWYRELLASR